MKKKEKILQKNMAMAGLMRWLSKNKIKRTETPFTISDVQSYIRRGNIPIYMGGNRIETQEEKYSKLYTIYEPIEKK